MLEEQKAAMKKHVIRWMEDNRGLILTLFGLPASFIFDMLMQVTTFSDTHDNRQITYYADYVLLMSLFCERPRPLQIRTDTIAKCTPQCSKSTLLLEIVTQ